MTTFSIIGAGRLGTSLGAALAKKGWDLKVIADRNPAAAREGRRIIGRGTATRDIGKAARGAQVLFICVPDDAVKAVARRLARPGVSLSGRLVFHTSGLLAAAVLDPLRKKGADAASLHPVQSFPLKGGALRLFRGIFWGVEGDADAVRTGRAVAKTLGGRALVLREKDKPLYHAACSLASNGFVSLEAAAVALLHAAGVRQKTAIAVLLPLLQGTLQNVKKLGLKEALTGPVVRGDVETVRRHLRVLKSHPGQEEVYRTLGREALRLVTAGTLPAHKLRALTRLLRGG
jgi:predicted short-subunit dehydrogenase-like oxidoreductase (DUF2520 family)